MDKNKKELMRLRPENTLIEEMEVIKESTDFIEKTLNKMINSNTCYYEDIKLCIEKCKDINNYANEVIKNDKNVGINLICFND